MYPCFFISMPATEKHTFFGICEKRAMRRRYQSIAALQTFLAVGAFGLSLLPWLDDIAYSWYSPPLPWLTRTSSMWAGAVALCLVWGRSGDTLWLSTAFDLLLIVAVVSAACFLLLVWNVISTDSYCQRDDLQIRGHMHLHGRSARGHSDVQHAVHSSNGEAALSPVRASGESSHAGMLKAALALVGHYDTPIACETFPSRTSVATFYGLGLAMSLQVGVCICAAFAVRSAKFRRRSEVSGDGSSRDPPFLPDSRPSSKLPRGWRQHVDPQSSRTFYEHTKSGRIQWEPPTGGRRCIASDAEDGRSGHCSDSMYRTS